MLYAAKIKLLWGYLPIHISYISFLSFFSFKFCQGYHHGLSKFKPWFALILIAIPCAGSFNHGSIIHWNSDHLASIESYYNCFSLFQISHIHVNLPRKSHIRQFLK